MKKITNEEANKIIAEKLHGKRHKHLVAKYRGQWYDVRGMNRQEIASAVTKIYGFLLNPDCII